jgi:hypothetical protein
MEELFFFLAFFFFLNKEPSALRIRLNIKPPKLSLQVSMNGVCYDITAKVGKVRTINI